MTDETSPTTPVELPPFEAALTHEQIARTEASENSDYAVARRLLLAALTKDSQQLLKGFGKPDMEEAFAELIEMGRDYITHLEGLLSLLSTAYARLLAVGSVMLGEAVFVAPQGAVQ